MVALNIRFVLQLFSGQRREARLSAPVTCTTKQFVGNVLALSIDIVLHPQLGGLTNPQTIALWHHLIVLGVVVFVLAGPPCETRSAAKQLSLPGDGQRGTRPLRTQEKLWEFSLLRKSEACSMNVGNALLRAISRMFEAAQLNPTAAVIMEHPREPSWLPHAASSWSVPEVQHVTFSPASVSVNTDRCMFGAPSKKPTTLLCFQCAHFQQLIIIPLTCDGLHSHSAALHGLGSQGCFRTAPATQYPQDFRSILAKLVIGQFMNSCESHPLPSPHLDDFASSALS